MAASNKTKNALIENFTKSIKTLAQKTRQQKLSTIERMADSSAAFIARKFGVPKNDVVPTIIESVLTSDKKYPAPAIDVLTEEGVAKTKKYIEYLWKYYECPNNKKTISKKSQSSKLPKIEAPAKKEEKQIRKPTVQIDLSSQVINKNGQVTIYWESENAVMVLDNNFGLPKKSKKTTGSLIDDKIKKRKTYWIVVVNENGDKARDEIDLELTDADLDPIKNTVEEIRKSDIPADKKEEEKKEEEKTEPTIVAGRSNLRLGGDEITKILLDIKKISDDILTNLTNQSLVFKQGIEIQRRDSEAQRRAKRESFMETPKKLGSQLMSSKLMQPVKSIFDWLVNFIVFTLLGRAFVKMIKWFGDPANKEKVDSLKRFLVDFGPALLATFVLFGTGLGKFIRSIVGLVVKTGAFILKKGIPTLINLLKFLGPKGRLAAAVIVGGIAARETINRLYKSPEEERAAPTVQQSGQPKPKPEKDPYQFTMPVMRNGGLVSNVKNHPALEFLMSEKKDAKDLMFNRGGLITEATGVDVTGAGPDTQLIATQPGEVVISKSAVDYFGGPEFFLRLNQMGGGTGKPTFSNNIQLAAGGGVAGAKTAPNMSPKMKFSPSLNMPAINLAMGKLKDVEQLSSLTKGSNDYIKPGGTSSHSNTPWSKVKSSTPIHSYLDSEGIPTIGWGSTFYDSVFTGNKRVKMGDVIDKSRADSIFKYQVSNLADTYASKMKYWPQMSDQQRAGLLVTGFNAPNAPLGSYKKLTAAINAGDMRSVAKEIQRDGPSASRIQMERSMLLKGPMDLTKVKEPAVIAPKKVEKPKNIIEKIGDSFNRIFRPQQSQSSNIQRLPVNAPEIGPNKNSNSIAFVNLAPIVANQPKMAQPQNGTDIPDFSAVSFAIDERMDNASTYGIA